MPVKTILFNPFIFLKKIHDAKNRENSNHIMKETKIDDMLKIAIAEEMVKYIMEKEKSKLKI